MKPFKLKHNNNDSGNHCSKRVGLLKKNIFYIKLPLIKSLPTEK